MIPAFWLILYWLSFYGAPLFAAVLLYLILHKAVDSFPHDARNVVWSMWASFAAVVGAGGLIIWAAIP